MTASPLSQSPLVPVSWGELLDKITILQIKAERIASQAAVANVRNELTMLSGCAAPLAGHPDLAEWMHALKSVNEALWVIEDRIREKEAEGKFDADFIELARSVYVNNDRRAKIKRGINLAVGSQLIEEKSYKG